jgi:type I restriction enzyme S subunit
MRRIKLEECCIISKGKTSIKWAEPGKYPLVTTAEDVRSSKSFDFEKEAVCIPLISSTGHGHASIKRLHFQKGRFALASIMCAVFSMDEELMLTEYLYVYLSLLKDDLLVSLMRGSANVSLTITDLKKVVVSVPSVAIQRDFINLYKSCEIYHKQLKSILADQEKFLIELEESILYEAFSGEFSQPGFLSSVLKIYEDIKASNRQVLYEESTDDDKPLTPYALPKDWIWVKLGAICEKLGAGSTPKGGQAVYQSEGVYFLRSQNIHNENVDLSNAVVIPREIHEKMKGSQVYYEDILLNITGASLGRCAIYSEKKVESNVSQHVAIVRLINKRLVKYLHLYMISPVFQREIQRVQTGISREGLSMRELQKIYVPLCSFEQQDSIFIKVDNFLKFKNELIINFQDTVLDAQNLFENILNSFLFKKLKIENHFVKSPFSFDDFFKASRPNTMRPGNHKTNRGSLKQLSISILKQEFADIKFSFDDIYNKTAIDYDDLKDIIFNLLSEKAPKNQASALKLHFDENDNKIVFKIIES